LGAYNFTTTGLYADTLGNNAGDKTVTWGDTAEGYLVTGGEDDDTVHVNGIVNTINMNTGTVTAWVKLDSGNQGDGKTYQIFALDRVTDNDDRLLFLRTAPNDLRAQYREADVNKNAETPDTGMESWTFVAMTWNTAGDLTLYKGDPGGGAAATTDMSSLNAGVPERAAIANRHRDMVAEQSWGGQMSDFIIWNDDLSQAELEAVYDLARNADFSKLDGLSNKAEILHWYPFTGDAYDHEDTWSSTSNADGTLVNGAYVRTVSVSGLMVANEMLVDSNFLVSGNIQGSGGLIVSGNIQGSGGLIVSGSIQGSSGYIFNDLDVDGKIWTQYLDVNHDLEVGNKIWTDYLNVNYDAVVEGDLEVDGDLEVIGKVTADSFDPEDIQYKHVSRQIIIDRYKNWACGGVPQTIEFYNIENGFKEYYYPLLGEFRDSPSANYNILEKLKEPIYNTNCETRFKWDSVYGAIKEYLTSDEDYKINVPEDKILDKETGELIDKLKINMDVKV